MLYHGNAGNDLSELASEVEKTVQALKPYAKKFDCIVVMGLSGEVVGIPAALALGKPIVIVRKEGVPNHSHGMPIVNAENMGKRCLFLDDFIAGGNTIRRVIMIVEDYTEAKVTMGVLYSNLSWPDMSPMMTAKQIDKYRKAK